MAGTIKDGLKAAETNKLRYGLDYYDVIGKAGGAAGHGKKGFAADKERAKIAGRKGGKASRKPRLTPDVVKIISTRARYLEAEHKQEKQIDKSRNTDRTIWSRLLQKIRG